MKDEAGDCSRQQPSGLRASRRFPLARCRACPNRWTRRGASAMGHPVAMHSRISRDCYPPSHLRSANAAGKGRWPGRSLVGIAEPCPPCRVRELLAAPPGLPSGWTSVRFASARCTSGSSMPAPRSARVVDSGSGLWPISRA